MKKILFNVLLSCTVLGYAENNDVFDMVKGKRYTYLPKIGPVYVAECSIRKIPGLSPESNPSLAEKLKKQMKHQFRYLRCLKSSKNTFFVETLSDRGDELFVCGKNKEIIDQFLAEAMDEKLQQFEDFGKSLKERDFIVLASKQENAAPKNYNIHEGETMTLSLPCKILSFAADNGCKISDAKLGLIVTELAGLEESQQINCEDFSVRLIVLTEETCSRSNETNPEYWIAKRPSKNK